MASRSLLLTLILLAACMNPPTGIQIGPQEVVNETTTSVTSATTSSTTRASTTTTTRPEPSLADQTNYLLVVNVLLKNNSLTWEGSPEELLEVGLDFCDALDRGQDLPDLGDTREARVGEAILAAAVIYLCPEHEDAAFRP